MLSNIFSSCMHKLWDIALRGYQRSDLAYTQRMHERRGCVPYWERSKARRYWLHAASLGEVRVALCLEEMLRSLDPTIEVLITTMTPSGSAHCMRHSAAMHYYVPYDTPAAVYSFVAAMQPDILFLIETELWPCMLYTMQKHNIPVCIVNGRLGNGSRRLHTALRRLWPCLHAVHSVAALSEDDAACFRRLGVPRAQRVGQIKWCAPAVTSVASSFTIKAWCILWASMQWSEHTAIRQVYTALRLRSVALCMLIAPRRMDNVTQWLQGWGSDVRVVRASQWCGRAEVDIVVIDTFGQMDTYYPLAQVVFVGGSLVRHGGQNVLEPARHGKCVVLGPHSYNFTEVVERMSAADCILEVKDTHALVQCLCRLHAAPEVVQAMGQRALQLCELLRQETLQGYRLWLQSVLKETNTGNIL